MVQLFFAFLLKIRIMENGIEKIMVYFLHKMCYTIFVSTGKGRPGLRKIQTIKQAFSSANGDSGPGAEKAGACFAMRQNLKGVFFWQKN